MTFILREQLDADAVIAGALYRKYIEINKPYFPESVLSLMANTDWQDFGNFGRHPHDGDLKSFFASNDKNIELLIRKSQADVEIQIKYKNVIDFDFPSFGSGLGFGIWAYDQFKFYNPNHHSPSRIKEPKMFRHEIEWLGGVLWTVTAAEIEVIWLDI